MPWIAPSEKDAAATTLERRLWDAADQFRASSGLTAQEYSGPILGLNWRQKSAALSQLKLAIEDTLDNGLPRAFSKELYNQKCSAVFEHVYESYPERNAGVYA
jgi:hypothetical protein